MRAARNIFVAGLLVACTPDEQPEAEGTCGAAPVQVWVVSALTFAERDDGVVAGFDLDGHVSGAGDDEGCGKADLLGLDGAEGVDNAFSALVPLLESTEAVAAESLIAQSISAGELLITFEIGAENWVEDDCVDFRLGRADAVPLVASDGSLLDDQTLPVHGSVASVSTEGVAEDGRLDVGGLEFNLPLDILNAELDFQVTRGRFRLQKRYDGKLTGIMGGVIPIRQITELLDRDDVNLEEFIPLVDAAADIRDADGECSLASLAFELEATPAYLVGTDD